MADERLLLGWLRTFAKRKGSDLYLTVDSPPMLRTDNGLEPLGDVLDEASIRKVIDELCNEREQACFEHDLEFNKALDLGRAGRFRVNMLRQRGMPAVVARRITAQVPTMEELGLPETLGGLVMERRGLVLLVGATGSGKSTTLAAMIDRRNSTEQGHILTVEDPIEYVHRHKQCIVTQREVGTDTTSYHEALKNSLRQRPDVILVGEIRDAEVLRQAMHICETGHLALSTLHANNADQAIDRMANLVELDERRHTLLNLSFNLRGIVSQRLVRKKGGGRALAMEILINSGHVQQLVREGDTKGLKAEMETGRDGMVTFDMCLLGLWRDGIIDEKVCLMEADNQNQVRAAMEASKPTGTTGASDAAVA
jgi:twitching motility protein PilU